MYLLCWNRVENFERWRKVFSSHESAHLNAGLTLVDLWREQDDPSLVHYLFKVTDHQKALSFINAADATKSAEIAGVQAGEFHFVESLGGY